MSKKTYRVSHITDLANVPVEHWDEMFDDLRHGLAVFLLMRAAAESAGETKTPAEMLPHIDFWFDGKREVVARINGKHVMTTKIEKVTP